MISFIVTTYNLEDWLLRRCLDSIVAQGMSRDQYEIIVVDDESAVSPQHVVDGYTRHADISLYVQRHARQGAARNLGVQYAKGEWMQFVDGDDYLLPGTIIPILQAAEINDLDLLMFGFFEVYGEKLVVSNRTTSKIVLSPITTGNDYMLHHNLLGVCWLQVFHRSLLDEPMFGYPLRFTEGIYVEDEEFVTKLVWRAQRMARTDVPVYAYYQRVNSTVHCRSFEHTDELFGNCFVVLKRLIDFETSLGAKAHEGLTRKVRFLALDILRLSLRDSDWMDRWKRSVRQLDNLGLYPLPAANYSWKYSMFRLLTNNGVGRRMLWLLEKRKKR
ncbi:MAG: glycosyltransferase family 2 protein [Bacteroidaceae bacterium]|nr:glycosyltransferase family 2 protein [Bacteroidaceae bacterium]